MEGVSEKRSRKRSLVEIKLQNNKAGSVKSDEPVKLDNSHQRDNPSFHQKKMKKDIDHSSSPSPVGHEGKDSLPQNTNESIAGTLRVMPPFSPEETTTPGDDRESTPDFFLGESCEVECKEKSLKIESTEKSGGTYDELAESDAIEQVTTETAGGPGDETDDEDQGEADGEDRDEADGGARDEADCGAVDEADCGAVDEAECGAVDEADCDLECIRRGFGQIFSRVQKGFTDLAHTFNGLVAYHKTQHCCDQEQGFGVYLPSPYPNGDLCRFGAHFVCSQEPLGFRIAVVCEDTLAYSAGLRPFDILTHVDNTDIRKHSIPELQLLFRQVDKTFSVIIQRMEQESGRCLSVDHCLQITIDGHLVTGDFAVKVRCARTPTRRVRSRLRYIMQRRGNNQTYLTMRPGPNQNQTAQVTMEPWSSEQEDASRTFYVDNYECDTRNICVLRHGELVMQTNNDNPDLPVYWSPPSADMSSCYLYVSRRPNGEDVFESRAHPGYFLVCESGQLRLAHCGAGQVPSQGAFFLNPELQQENE